MRPKRFTDKQWFSLPLDVRRAWWRETDYGKHEPSPRLAELIAVLLVPDLDSKRQNRL
jgi:hypothetical protein